MGASTPNDEVQVMEVGIDARGLDKTSGMPWACNVLWKSSRYEGRDGFGTLAQYGTTMRAGRDTEAARSAWYGYGRMLGGTTLTTKAGHDQLLTVHQLYAYTGDIQQDDTGRWIAGSRAEYLNLIAVNVYDVTTDSRAEFILHSNTSENASRAHIEQPHYQQFLNSSNPRWLVASPESHGCSFVQTAGLTYIIVEGFGIWQYRPVDPLRTSPDRMLHVGGDSDVDLNGSRSYGESSAIQRIDLTTGFKTGYDYLTQSEFTVPVAACNYLNRIVYAAGRRLYFSDPDYANNILIDNQYVVSSELEITALAEVKGALFIFTPHETWLYNPNADDTLISSGRIYCLSRDIGCLSPRHIVNGDDAVYWMDTRGVHRSTGGTSIETLTGNIESWFNTREQMQDPASSYKVNQGYSDQQETQPRVRIDWVGQLKPEFGNLTWDQTERVLYCTAHDITLTWSGSAGWTVFNYETSCTTALRGATVIPVVGLTRNIINPHLYAKRGNIYMVGGVDQTAYEDPDHRDVIQDQSFYILQQMRGGALDRSSAEQEDHRQPNGGWEKQSGFSGASTFYIGKAVKFPKDYLTILQQTQGDTWWIPIYLTGPDAVVGRFRLRFTVDTDFWWFYMNNPGQVGELEFVVPSERVPSRPAYRPTPDVMTATEEVRAYLAGVLNPFGEEVRIAWRGAAAANTWAHHPSINLNTSNANPLIYIPVFRVPGTENTTVCNIVNEVTLTDINNTGVDTVSVYVWREAPFAQGADVLSDDRKAQPVDWAIKSAQTMPGKVQLKARGAYTRIQSTGSATVKHTPDWIWGPLNTCTGSDYKDYSGQIVDNAVSPLGVNEIPKIDSIRDRLLYAPTGVMAQTIGHAPATAGPTWGDVNDATKGNLLIADPAVDTISTSEGVRGESFSVMLHGTLNHPGESIKVQSVTVQTREVGGRRRGGR